jgi:tRNA (mo5U34)-methyltransferase
VLYHLFDPVAHLCALLPHVGRALMLDTHVAGSDAELHRYETGGRAFDYQRFRESGRLDPFSGMRDDSKWLPEPVLLALIADAGFSIDHVERRGERNGARVRILARR